MTQKELRALFNISFGDFQKVMDEHTDSLYLSEKYGQFRKNMAEFLLNIDSDMYAKFLVFAKNKVKN